MIGGALALTLLVATPAISGAASSPVTPVPEVPGTMADDDDTTGQTLRTGTDRDERMTVAVAVQGQGPYHFMIDTGSQQTVVSSALATTLGLTLGPAVTVVGMAGSSDVATARLETFAIGNRAFHDLTVPLLEGQNIGADGIVGTDSLQGQRVTLDFDQGTIAIAPAQETQNNGYEIVVHARKRLGRLIMTNAMIDGIRADVVIDTGATSAVGNLALQKAMSKQLVGTVRLSSVTGEELAAELVIAHRLKIEDLSLTNVSIAFADSPAFKELGLERRPAIFLGMRELRVFKRIAIDFSTRKVLFDLPANVERPDDFLRKIASRDLRTK
ncbi:aspartyl protease [Novosphingobium sp. PhB165]|uniref:aspartyl protease family protein n=1 Tax=Novosphingobium sp. PhB165 TaxID=2485105 RepID=UPI001050D2EA|nr:aspartyl protease family protein [Novosphingobium sp. PhB165]TCM17365.1 aspartyl protease [Novosphingobium sp. PhB165]